ncbi:MAG TPA: polysaccharide deacetylase family protein [Dehalococcoidia bacterium]|nr:polysaccharide deacetylase family protein [Dehalococcoidia bacterium]
MIIEVCVLALLVTLATGGRRVAAQSLPPAAVEVAVFQQQPDGGNQPLAGATITLKDAQDQPVVQATSGADGRVHLVAPAGVYTLVAASDTLDGIASLVCGDAGWNTSPDTQQIGDRIAITESGVQLRAGQDLCREALFAPPPPPPPPPPSRPVHLTFDDGYVDLCQTVEMVIGLGIHATFFLTGQAILANPGCVQRLVAAGNQLGNHSFAHENLTRLSYAGIISTLQRTEDAAQAVAGISTRPYCRPPYGAVNATVRQAAAAFGCQMVLWDRDTLDWTGRPVGLVENSALSVGCNGEIVLMHTQAFPRDQFAVPMVVQTLKDRGCSLTNIDGS